MEDACFVTRSKALSRKLHDDGIERTPGQVIRYAVELASQVSQPHTSLLGRIDRILDNSLYDDLCYRMTREDMRRRQV